MSPKVVCPTMMKSGALIFSLLLWILTKPAVAGCYTSIFAFGDSLTDNGNLVLFSAPRSIHQGHLPNGETYFHHATGRCCDGRLIVDFLAEQFGLPFPPPSAGIKNSNRTYIRSGVNFAVAGARTLDTSFYDAIGLSDPFTNASLKVQLGWFKDLLPTFCGTKRECRKHLKTSFVLLGTIGGNDYRYALFHGRNQEETQLLAQKVTDAIISTVVELVEHGVGTVMVPGLAPDGCLAVSLASFGDQTKDDYDPFTGCLIGINKLAVHHNKLLMEGLNLIRGFYPQATIIYADYYNAAMKLYVSPEQYGFVRTLAACCGSGGPYNFNTFAMCGDPLTSACPDPSVYVNWDGSHFTEAANRWITVALLKGPYTTPHIDASCISESPDLKLVTYT